MHVWSTKSKPLTSITSLSLPSKLIARSFVNSQFFSHSSFALFARCSRATVLLPFFPTYTHIDFWIVVTAAATAVIAVSAGVFLKTIIFCNLCILHLTCYINVFFPSCPVLGKIYRENKWLLSLLIFKHLHIIYRVMHFFSSKHFSPHNLINYILCTCIQIHTHRIHTHTNKLLPINPFLVFLSNTHTHTLSLNLFCFVYPTKNFAC